MSIINPTIEEKKPIPTTPLRYLWFVTRPHMFLGAMAFLCVTVAEFIGISLPYMLKMLVDTAERGSDTVVFNLSLLQTVILIPVAIGVMFALWRLSGFIGMIWLVRTEAESYVRLHDYVTKHSHSYFLNRFAGALSNKISNASEGVFRLSDGTLWGHYPNFLAFVIGGFYIFITNVLVGYVFIVLLAVLLPINYYLAKHRKPYVVEYSDRKSSLKGVSVDILTNIGAARQFARRRLEVSNIKEYVQCMASADIRAWRLSEWMLVINNFIIVAATAVMVITMYQFWQAGTVTTGDFVLVITLVFSLQRVLTFIGSSINEFIKVYGQTEEGLTEVLKPHEIVDAEGAKKLKVKEASIEWKNVDFNFGENKVFDNFNLKIETGQKIGLVGPSGAGKTTFVSLLLRQHDIDAGTICIEGQDIAKVTQDSLRQNIAVVPQEPMLFHRTIRENIAYGKPRASMKEIEEVAKKAQAHDFIVSLPEGYNTLVGERGVKLSGGQKQRVAIARAMLKDAPILVLDEATSALDSESEVAIQKALHELMEGKTVVAVAHRLSTLREMDRILVLEGGKIVEDGTHTELTKAGGTYQKLWEHQAGGFLQE